MAIPTRTVALYERILEAVPGGVVYVAHDGTLLLANEPAQRFLGLRLDEEEQRWISDFQGETYNDDGTICAVEDYPVSRCLATGETQPAQVVGVRQPSGEVRWAVFTALPFNPGDGNPLGAVVSFVDITERKRAEQHVRLLQAELAQRERLATVGTLAAAVAHEVNNPLAFIFLGLESMQDALAEYVDGPIPTDIQEPVTQVQEGATRVRDIVADLMTFARVRDRATEPVDVRESLQTAIRMASPELRYRATIVEDLEDVPPVLAVTGRLSQVFLNLVLNAGRSFDGPSPDNEVRVTAREEEDQVVVEVSDNGRGVDPDLADRIFDPFFTTRDDGMGLGLPISRSLVEEMDGTLTLVAEHGPGAMFRVSLPAASPKRLAAGRDRVVTPIRKTRVLLVDDERIILKLGDRALSPEHEVVVADSVADGIARLEQGQFDVVVCDTMMLDGSGIEVYRWLEEHHREMTDRFLFITGGTFTDVVSDFFAENNPPVLRKPFSRTEFRAQIAELVGPA